MKSLFVILTTFIGLFVGTAVGSFFVPEGSGLAGPAIALGYGVVGAILAGIGSFVAARKMAPAKVTRVTMVVGLISVLLGIWLTYRAQSRTSPESDSAPRGVEGPRPTTQEPTANP